MDDIRDEENVGTIDQAGKVISCTDEDILDRETIVHPWKYDRGQVNLWVKVGIHGKWSLSRLLSDCFNFLSELEGLIG